MNSKEIKTLISYIGVGKDIRLTIKDNNELSRFRNAIRGAQIAGYRICFSKLYDNVYYFEKLEEGHPEKLKRR